MKKSRRRATLAHIRDRASSYLPGRRFCYERSAQERGMPKSIQIRMGGYGPATTGFSKSLKFIGERLEQQFGDRIDVKYVWNIMDFGYRAEDILWLVESGILTLGYQSSSYLTD